MKARRPLCILLALLVLTLAQAAAKPLTLKLATAVPENTPWGAGLNKLAAEWKRISKAVAKDLNEVE